jgi:GGDEF domain-containing protein
MERLSMEDHLTGLPNRRAFFDCAMRPNRALKKEWGRNGYPVSRLNDFKGVNDTLAMTSVTRFLKALGNV